MTVLHPDEHPPAGLLRIITGPGERDWARASFLAAALTRLGCRAWRVTDGPSRGDLLVEPTANDSAERLADRVARLAADERWRARLEGVTVEVGADGGEERVVFTVPNVALFGGAGSPFHHLDIFTQAGFDTGFVSGPDIRAGRLAEFDVVAVPGGGWEHMNGQLDRLGREGARAIRAFVEGGGAYLSSCAGTYSTLAIEERYLSGWHDAESEMPKLDATSWLTNPEHPWGLRSPGIGVIRAKLADPAHPLSMGMPASFDVVYYNGPILEPASEELRPLVVCERPDPERFTFGEALYGSPTDPDRAEMSRACRLGLLGGAYQRLGTGWVIGFGLHPEFGTEPAMLRWGRPARLLTNAVEWACSQGARMVAPPVMPAGVSDADAIAAEATEALSVLREGFQRWAQEPLDPPPAWLGADEARSAFGLDAITMWQASTRGGVELCAELIGEVEAWRLRHAGVDHVAARLDDVGAQARGALARSVDLLSSPGVEAGRQDLGFVGVIPLVKEITTLLTTLDAGGTRHPYRAVAMSYLSGFGLLTAAALSLSAAAAVLDRAALIAALTDG